MSRLTLHSIVAAENEGGEPHEEQQDFRTLPDISSAVCRYIYDSKISKEEWKNPQIREGGHTLAEVCHDGVIVDPMSGEVFFEPRPFRPIVELESGIIPVAGYNLSLGITPAPDGTSFFSDRAFILRGREVEVVSSYRFDENGTPEVHVGAHWKMSRNALAAQIFNDLSIGITNAVSAWVITPEAQAMAARNQATKHRISLESCEDKRRLDVFELKRSTLRLAFHTREVNRYEAMSFGVPPDASNLPAIKMTIGRLLDEESGLEVPASLVEEVMQETVLPDLLEGAFTEPPSIRVSARLQDTEQWIHFKVPEADRAHEVEGVIAYLSEKLSNLSPQHQKALWAQATPVIDPAAAPGRKARKPAAAL